MAKKVLILSGSPRREGNSDILCDEFLRGAKEAGHDVEKIRVAEKNIGFCRACYACQSGKCVIEDDMADILQRSSCWQALSTSIRSMHSSRHSSTERSHAGSK